MRRKTIINDDPIPWLLETDPVNPGVRYFALRDLMGMTTDSAKVCAAREMVMTTGPVPAILAQQHDDGYGKTWVDVEEKGKPSKRVDPAARHRRINRPLY